MELVIRTHVHFIRDAFGDTVALSFADLVDLRNQLNAMPYLDQMAVEEARRSQLEIAKDTQEDGAMRAKNE